MSQSRVGQLEQLVAKRTEELQNAKNKLEIELIERNRAERGLRDSEEKYRQLVDNANVGIVVTQEGWLRFFNPWVLQISGLDPQRLRKEPFINFVHADDREMVMAHHIRRLKHEEVPEPYMMRILDRDNNIRWVENKGVIISWNDEPATLNFLSDVTEQIEAEMQIRKLSQQLLMAQENERVRISRDLHDSVAQELSTMQIVLQSVIKEATGLSEEMKTRMQTLSGQLKQVVINVRQLSYGLRPPTLDQLGLVETVYQHCEDFSKIHDITVDFVSAGMENLSLPYEKSINLYRIVQEALTNARRHSGADMIVVRLIAAHPNIICRIQDNGEGFTRSAPAGADAAARNGRMGLRSMEERVRLMGGSFKLQSAPNEGTKIVVEIPIKDQ